jgi:acetyl esterase/lipase
MATKEYKNAHLSALPPNSDFAPMQAIVKEQFEALWAQGIDAIRAIELPEGANRVEGTPMNLDVNNWEIDVSKGAKIKLWSWNKDDGKKDKLLFFVMHSGGWAIGDHKSEESACRFVADRNEAVAVSVEYRL